MARPEEERCGYVIYTFAFFNSWILLIWNSILEQKWYIVKVGLYFAVVWYLESMQWQQTGPVCLCSKHAPVAVGHQWQLSEETPNFPGEKLVFLGLGAWDTWHRTRDRLCHFPISHVLPPSQLWRHGRGIRKRRRRASQEKTRRTRLLEAHNEAKRKCRGRETAVITEEGSNGRAWVKDWDGQSRRFVRSSTWESNNSLGRWTCAARPGGALLLQTRGREALEETQELLSQS